MKENFKKLVYNGYGDQEMEGGVGKENAIYIFGKLRYWIMWNLLGAGTICCALLVKSGKDGLCARKTSYSCEGATREGVSVPRTVKTS